MKELFKRLNRWIMKWADTKWGPFVLFLCAFADSSFFGLPTPFIFVALVLLNTAKAYRYVLFGLIGTMAGSVVGYAIGHFLWLDKAGNFTGVAQFLFNFIPGFSEAGYNKIQILFERRDFWILFFAAALPVPYKIFTISSGVFNIEFWVFCLATLISQGLKFFFLALLTIRLGRRVKKLFEINWKPIAIIATASIAVTILVIKIF